MPSRDDLERELAFWRAALDEARNDANKARMRMRDASGIVRTIEGQLRGPGRRALSKRPEAISVKTMTPAEHGLATSKGRAHDPLVKAANAKEMTQEQLAERVGVSAGLLSKARRGSRSIRRAVALDIEALTGFAATKANWPGGISD